MLKYVLVALLLASPLAASAAPKQCIPPPQIYSQLSLAGCEQSPRGMVCVYPFAFKDRVLKWQCGVLLIQSACDEGFVPQMIVCQPMPEVANR